MSTPQLLIAIATIAVTTSTLVSAQSRLTPGLYEMTMDMSLPGKSGPPAIGATQCLTAEDLKDLGDPRNLMRAAEDEDCKVSDLVTAADRLTFNFTCAGESVSRAEFNYGIDSYSGIATTKREGEVVTNKMSGKRIGECK